MSIIFMPDKEIDDLINFLEKDSEKFPGVFIIHNLEDFRVIYMSKRGLRELKITQEEIQALSAEEYHNRYFNPEDAKDYIPKLKDFLYQNTKDSITFFQQVRTSENADWVWHITSMRILTRDEKNSPLTMFTISFPVDPNKSFTSKINRLLEENKFLKENMHNFMKLTKREIDLLKYFAQGKTTPEIGELLFISNHTIETHRKNIRKKLNANSNYDLFRYASAFDLI